MSGKRRRHPALDLHHPFFRPIWRRVAVMVFLVIWLAIEIVSGSFWWALLVGGIAIYAAHEFFLVFDPPADEGEGEP